MIDQARVTAIAEQWLNAWNSHDADAVVAHFAGDVVVSSPVAAQLRPESDGILRGRDSVLSYYRDGLAASPDLHFTLVDVCTGVDDITIVYRNQRDTLVAEMLTLAPSGEIAEVRVCYAG